MNEAKYLLDVLLGISSLRASNFGSSTIWDYFLIKD